MLLLGGMGFAGDASTLSMTGASSGEETGTTRLSATVFVPSLASNWNT